MNSKKDSTMERLPEAKQTKSRLIKFYGVFLSLLAALLSSISIILVKKASLLSSSDQNFIRYSTQLIITSSVVYWKKIDLSELRNQQWIFLTRAVIGVIGLMASYTALSLIHPSDASSIANSNIVVTAVISRFLFKEKFTPIHVVSLIMTCIGVLLVSQPSFIFKHAPTHRSNISLASNSTPIQSPIKFQVFENPSLLRTFGLLCSCVHAIAITLIVCLVKKLSDKNVHYLLNVLYTAAFGTPFTFAISLVLILTNNSKFIFNITENFDEFKYHLAYSILAAIFGTVYQMMFSLCLKYEDASKFTIIKTSDLFFIFVMQYFLLNIKSNMFKVIGGVLIFLSGAGILSVKIFDQKPRKEDEKPSLLSRCLFFKF
jgi:drug/metabolite transporter (DMT)-like permease